MNASDEEMKRLAVENGLMAEIGKIISSSLKIEEIYERFAGEVRKLIPFDRIMVGLNNAEKGTVTVTYISGLNLDGRRAGDVYPFKHSGNEVVMQTRKGFLIQPESIEELERSQLFNLISTFQSGLRSIMSAPLIWKNQVIGALHFRSKKTKAYTDRDLKLAERIAAQIAGAIANAQLFLELERVEAEKEKLIQELQDALVNIKTLRGLIPICASCKKIRDDTGYWNQIEAYIGAHSEAQFSHGICPDCMKKLYGDIEME